MASGSQHRGQLHSSHNSKQAQLGNAYQELGRELGTESLKVIGGYTLGRIIGEGTFGSVHLATHRLTGTRCAVKKIPKSATAQLTRELHHHRRLHHPHIVHLHEIVATETHVWLVSELCSGGELFDYLVEHGRLMEGEARRIFGELTVAVGWLHRQGVVHRDLKLENVLLDGELRVKLGDLGFAREWDKGRLMETYCGTIGYASPEMLACKKYLGVETDIWSLGVILYTLLCGGLPFDHDDERVMRERIIAGAYEEPEWLSQESKMLIRDVLKIDPAQRLSIEEILKHPWFKMPIADIPYPTTPNPDRRRSSEAVTDSRPESDHSPGSSGSAVPQRPVFATRSSEPDSVPRINRNHSGEFSQTEQQLERLHSVYDHAESRRHESTSDSRPLTVVREDNEFVPDQLEIPLNLPLHSRTPSRTKRRSVSSQLSLERRHSHHNPAIVDYLHQLNEQQGEVFSSPSEKHLLKGLTALGIDEGQLTHSVRSDACDSAAAFWWILRGKQHERGETDASIEAMNAATARRKERAAAYVKEERRKAREDAPQPYEQSVRRFPEVTFVGSTPSASRTGRGTETSTVAHPHTPPKEPIIRTDLPASPSDGSPKERERIKARSPSMSMLQRATSALTGKWIEEKSAVDEVGGRLSPTKLVKPQHKVKPSDTNVTSQPSHASFPSGRSDVTGVSEDTEDATKSQNPKRDSLWTTFRHMFAEDRRRKRYFGNANAQGKVTPTVILTRGPAARSIHMNRIPQISSRRGSVDVRPSMQSRRSSSVNSRRSSFTSSHIPGDMQDNLHALGRHSSHRSHGSQTPTSDREAFEFPSRPNSATSLRRGSAKYSSTSLAVRSPSLHSDSSGRPPPSPLHEYQRRHPSGSNSRRVRHYAIIPEARALHPKSVASSIRSNSSSRRSSLDRNRQDEAVVDSDDPGKDDALAVVSRRRSDHNSLAHQIHRTRSPLVHGVHKRTHPKSKPPSRDVFQQKDNEWVDEEESPTFQGGLGQGSSIWQASRTSNRSAASFPATLPHRPHSKTEPEHTQRGKAKREDGPDSGAQKEREISSRRAALQDRSVKPPVVMEEVQEEDEE